MKILKTLGLAAAGYLIAKASFYYGAGLMVCGVYLNTHVDSNGLVTTNDDSKSKELMSRMYDVGSKISRVVTLSDWKKTEEKDKCGLRFS